MRERRCWRCNSRPMKKKKMEEEERAGEQISCIVPFCVVGSWEMARMMNSSVGHVVAVVDTEMTPVVMTTTPMSMHVCFYSCCCYCCSDGASCCTLS